MPDKSEIIKVLPAEFRVSSVNQIASLWSDYGHIYRLAQPKEPKSLILKAIHPPSRSLKDSSESHLRKLLSYEVERWFYHNLASRLPTSAKVARSYVSRADDDGNLLLEDLNIEFPSPAYGNLGREPAVCVLRWLAAFHATFFRIHRAENLNFVPSPNEHREKVGQSPGRSSGVWRRGTYWYLATRREELAETDEEEYSWLYPWIEKVDGAIESEIRQYGTLVHGDVKDANILFNRPLRPSRPKKSRQTSVTPSELRCALYDFQYVGLGLPTLDLVYFIGTSIDRSLLSPASERQLLELYHTTFLTTLRPTHEDPSQVYPFDRFLRHWELAIVDWYRFMAGWGFWGSASWAERRAREIVTVWEANPTNWLF